MNWVRSVQIFYQSITWCRNTTWNLFACSFHPYWIVIWILAFTKPNSVLFHAYRKLKFKFVLALIIWPDLTWIIFFLKLMYSSKPMWIISVVCKEGSKVPQGFHTNRCEKHICTWLSKKCINQLLNGRHIFDTKLLQFQKQYQLC